MNLEFKKENSYGHARYYPHNDDAKNLLALCKRKSLSDDELQFCADAGWSVTVPQDPITFQRRPVSN